MDRKTDKTIRDAKMPGLGLRKRDGKESWIWQRKVGGRTMRRTLGDRSALSRGEARQVALRMLKGEVDAPAVMRLAAFNERYMADMQPQWRETT